MMQMREAPLLGFATLAALVHAAFASEAWKTGQGMTESTNDAVVENVTAPPSAPAGEVNLQGVVRRRRRGPRQNFPRAPHLTRRRPPLQIQWFVLAGIAVVVCCGVSIFCFIKRKAVARRAAEFEAAKKNRRRSSTGVA